VSSSAQRELLRARFTGMGWATSRLLEAMPDAYDFYFDEMSQVKLPTWPTGRTALIGDAAFGPSPMSGQGTSLALIGAYLIAHRLAESPDPATAFRSWEQGFRPNVAENQDLARAGLSTLLPATFMRNQSMRALSLLTRYGRGLGGRIEPAPRGVTLPE
jgi:2-polyprenyl-6-methoxyphenol hydroxylase-like FAD-dependent oxidoreductase